MSCQLPSPSATSWSLTAHQGTATDIPQKVYVAQERLGAEVTAIASDDRSPIRYDYVADKVERSMGFATLEDDLALAAKGKDIVTYDVFAPKC